MIEREAKVDEDRPKIARGHLQPPVRSACRCRSTRRCSTASRSGHVDLRRCKAIDTPYNTYLHTGPAADADRQPRPGVDRGGAQPGARPVQGDPICVGLPDPTDCHYLYYVSPTRTAATCSPATLEQHEANVAAAPASRRCSGDHRRAPGVAAVIGHPVGTACRRRCTTPASPPPGSTGCTSPSRSRRAAPAPRSTAMRGARPRRAVGDDAAQGGRRRGGRRARPGGGRAARVNTVVPLGDGRLRRPQHRRRRASSPRCGADGVDSPGSAVVRARRRRSGAGGRRRARPRRRGDDRRGQPLAPSAPTAAAALAGGVGRGRRRSTTSPTPTSSSTPRRSGWARDELPCDPPLLRAGQVVADIVYHPLRHGAAAAPPRRPARTHGRRARHARPPGGAAAGAVDRRHARRRGDAGRRRARAGRSRGRAR